jgi:dTDP-4-dehydrorhamnose reductase
MDDLKILITGADGQLGKDLAPRLKREGCTVKAYSSDALDITRRDKTMEVVTTERPHVVYNLAAYTKVDRAEVEIELAYAVNSEGAGNVADAAAMAGAPLVHISTDYVFDGLSPIPYAEDDETGPINVYGQSKLLGETEIKKRLGDHMIVRTSWLYGSSGHNFVKTILALASKNAELKIVADQIGSPTWTGDLADFLVEVARRRRESAMPYGTFHFANEGVASWYDLAVAAVEEARAIGAELACKTITPITTADYPTDAERPPCSILDKTKTKKEFAVTIPHWRAALRKMLKEIYGEKRDA